MHVRYTTIRGDDRVVRNKGGGWPVRLETWLPLQDMPPGRP